MSTETRNLRFFLFFDLHTLQGQPITGTPVEVPVPKSVIFVSLGFFAIRVEWAQSTRKCCELPPQSVEKTSSIGFFSIKTRL
jgi:hypothetical protein